MAVIGSFDVSRHFNELDASLFTNSGVLTAAQRKVIARNNLDVYSVAEVDAFVTNTYTKAEADALLAAKQPIDATLTALAAYNTNGILTQTAADTFVGRTITGTANQLTVTNGDGVAGNPTLSLPADVLIPTVLTIPNTGLHILDTDASHDLIVKPGSNLTADHTFTLTTGDADRTFDISAGNVTITAAAATVLDDATVGDMLTTLGGQPVDSDLTAIAGLAANGLIARTGTGTMSARTITGTANQITVSNGDGVSGNPTLSLDATIAAIGGLTITAGSFLRGSAADTFDVQSIIGTVSQSAGVATGAIFERGSNANGEYVRFADGTQICTFNDPTGQATATAAGALFQGAAGITWTFPAAFAANPVPTGSVENPGRWLVFSTISTTTVIYRQLAYATSASTVACNMMAVGRWF